MTDEYVPATDLDPARLGEILLWLIPAAASARHANPAETLRDYVKPTDAEMAFVRDLFTRSTEEAAALWYQDIDHAAVLADYRRALIWT